MKRYQKKRTVLAVTFLVGLIICVLSCNISTDKSENGKKTADDKNAARFESGDKERDAKFLTEVADINLTEIKFGQLAQQKSKNAGVKELGRLMETDHTKTSEELASLAKSKEVSLPTAIAEKTQKKYDELNALQAADFDREYADMMVKGHQDAISLFENTLKDTKDVDINNWAEKTLPALRMHLDHSMMCQKNLSSK